VLNFDGVGKRIASENRVAFKTGSAPEGIVRSSRADFRGNGRKAVGSRGAGQNCAGAQRGPQREAVGGGAGRVAGP